MATKQPKDVTERIDEIMNGKWVQDEGKPDAFFGKCAYEMLQRLLEYKRRDTKRIAELEDK